MLELALRDARICSSKCLARFNRLFPPEIQLYSPCHRLAVHTAASARLSFIRPTATETATRAWGSSTLQTASSGTFRARYVTASTSPNGSAASRRPRLQRLPVLVSAEPLPLSVPERQREPREGSHCREGHRSPRRADRVGELAMRRERSPSTDRGRSAHRRHSHTEQQPDPQQSRAASPDRRADHTVQQVYQHDEDGDAAKKLTLSIPLPNKVSAENVQNTAVCVNNVCTVSQIKFASAKNTCCCSTNQTSVQLNLACRLEDRGLQCAHSI